MFLILLAAIFGVVCYSRLGRGGGGGVGGGGGGGVRWGCATGTLSLCRVKSIIHYNDILF